MIDDLDELQTLAGRAVLTMFGASPGFVGRIEPGAALALSGETTADLNMLLLGPGPRAQNALEEAVALASARKLPMVAFVAPQVAAQLQEAALWLGLSAVGSTPLMVFRPDGPVAPGKACDVSRADGEGEVRIAGDLVASAFALPRDAVARTLDAAIGEAAGAEAFVAAMDGRPMSAVTVMRVGATSGIWCMATPSDRQGQGAGRALLTHVLEAQRQAGVDRFYLFATAAGRPLYESIGFTVVADYALWVLGDH